MKLFWEKGPLEDRLRVTRKEIGRDLGLTRLFSQAAGDARRAWPQMRDRTPMTPEECSIARVGDRGRPTESSWDMLMLDLIAAKTARPDLTTKEYLEQFIERVRAIGQNAPAP